MNIDYNNIHDTHVVYAQTVHLLIEHNTTQQDIERCHRMTKEKLILYGNPRV